MPRPFTRCSQRNSVFVRQWRVLVLLRAGGWTLAELSERLGCSQRTARRDIEALEEVPFPIMKIGKGHGDGPGIWYLGEFRGWPRDKTTPTSTLDETGRAVGG